MGRSYLFDFISYTFRSFEPTDLFQRAFLIFYVDNFQCFFSKIISFEFCVFRIW